MAYLHCHSCNWSQDDFWEFKPKRRGYWFYWGYNPISYFFSLVFSWKYGLWRPRRIDYGLEASEVFSFKRRDPFSWYVMWKEFLVMLRVFKKQTWWTWSSWKKSKDKAVCPNCGKRNFDID